MSRAVTILGAGVAGLCAAVELSGRGFAVRVIDPAGGPGQQGCSWWAGGMLAPLCEGETAPEAVTRLGTGAAAWWQAAGASVTHAGTLVVALARDKAELARFARRTTGHRALDRAALGRLEPQLEGRFDHALFVEAEAHLSPRLALDALTSRLAEAGIEIETEGTPCGQIVDCRGLAARDALPGLRGVRGEMVVLRAPEVTLQRPVRLLHPRFPLYIVPRGDGVFMLGATQIESAHRGPVTLRSVVELLNAAYALHPAFAEAEVLEFGADARPAFADHLPRLLRRGDRLYLNGLFRHGFLLAPAMAQMLGDHLEHGQIPELWA